MSSQCIYCHQRKGKRSCPALGGMICSPCCGEHRLSEITCPQDCIYLAGHEGYQQEKLGQQFLQERQKIVQELQRRLGNQVPTLINLFDMSTYAYFHDKTGAQDHEVLLGFDFLRTSLSPIEIPGTSTSAFGQLIQKEVEGFLKSTPDAKEILPEVVEGISSFLKSFSEESIHSRRYLKGLIGFLEGTFPETALRLKELSSKSEKRIITLEDEVNLQKMRKEQSKSGF